MKSQAGNQVSDWLVGLGRITLLAKESASALCTLKAGRRDLLQQLHFMGVKSQSVVLITGAFTGMVLCVQAYLQFHKIKMDTAALAFVSVSMCDELGPVLTGLMVAGRVGAAIAAELGTMRVTEQIDALRTLATHPVDYLVAPRIVALLIAMPLLTVEAMAIGIGSAYFVGSVLMNIDSTYLWENMLKYTGAVDVIIGLIKAFFYGGIVALIGCYKGMYCGEGAVGVGRATTESVVYSSITILIANFFLTLSIGMLLKLL
ncbi:MAG: ABC transporter permease [Verrucomicrobiota bacterium]